MKYYKSKQEVLNNRQKGDRIYYNSKKKMYFKTTPNKDDFWKGFEKMSDDLVDIINTPLKEYIKGDKNE